MEKSKTAATQNPSIASYDRGVGGLLGSVAWSGNPTAPTPQFTGGRINKPDKFSDGQFNSISLIMHQDTNLNISQMDFIGLEPLLDRPVAFHPSFMPITTKCPIGALFLSQAWYWRSKGRKSDGWVYKTHYQFFEETGLSQKQQIRVRKILCTKIWWQEKIEKVNGVPTYHYRIDRLALMAELNAMSETVRSAQREFSESAQREFSESAQREFSESAQREFSLYKDTEITSREYSSEIISTKLNSLTAEAEFGELFQENSEQEHSTSIERAKPQQTSSFDSNSISGEEKAPQPPARSTNADKMPCGDRYDRKQANRKRAAASSYFEIGLKNKRWQDRADFDKFVAYAKIWGHNRQEDPQLNPDGTKYGDGYVNSILSRTASTQDENDKDLMCWKCWNQERSAQVFEQNPEPEPEPVVEVDEIERRRQIKSLTEKLENFKRQRAAEAAEQQAIEQEREARWAKLGWID